MGEALRSLAPSGGGGRGAPPVRNAHRQLAAAYGGCVLAKAVNCPPGLLAAGRMQSYNTKCRVTNLS